MRSRFRAALNRALFGITALPYDLVSRPQAWKDHCREMLERVPSSAQPRRILDVGCGPGVSAIEMAKAGADQIVGLDFSAPMLERARRHLAREAGLERVQLVRGDAAALPFPGGAFDALTGHSLLYLLPDQEASLAEMRRVLRPGGALVLLEPARGPSLGPLARIAGESPRFAVTMGLWRVVSGRAGRFSPAALAAVLQSAGFAQVAIEPTLGGLGLLARAIRP